MESYLEGLTTLDPRREKDHKSYHEHLLEVNDALALKVNEGLTRKLMDWDPKEDFYVATAGSDARSEKGTVSPVELILYVREEQPSEGLLQRIYDFVWGPVASRPRKDFEQYVEVKSLARGNLTTTVFAANSERPRRMVSPNRFLDSQMAYHRNLRLNEDFWEEFMRRIANGEGKDMLEDLRIKVKNHKKCTLAGTQPYGGKVVTHYDLEEGVAYYDPDNNIHSFKQGPIRVMQFAMARDKVAALRDGMDRRVLSSVLPSNTVRQLNRVLVEGLTELSREEIADLADNYQYFLWLYQISQARHAQGDMTSEFNAREVKKRLEDVARLCSNGNEGKPNRRIIKYKKKAA